LVIGIQSDGLFTVEEQYELGEGIPNSEVVIIESGEGHDGFLLEFVKIRALIGGFLRSNAPYLYENELVDDAPIIIGKSLFGEAEGDLLQW
jgi:homoserine O-acetyltransferase